jgi:hypothetical protein
VKQAAPFQVPRGWCELEVEMQGPEDEIFALMPPCIYVAREVVMSYISKKMEPYANPRQRTIELPPICKTIEVAWSDFIVNFILTGNFVTLRPMEVKVKRYMQTALQRATGAVLLMICEYADHEGPMKDAEFEALFAAVDDGLINRKDLVLG